MLTMDDEQVAHMLENAHLNGDQDGRGEET
jgi:hypothetical protein